MTENNDFPMLSFSEPKPVPEDHPLRTMFRGLVRQAFRSTLGVPEDEISRYLADMLADFALMDNVYRIRDAAGDQVTRVAEMLMEADIRGNATSFDRERTVHKHIGDFTLFWLGVFPESLDRLQGRSADRLIDYARQGKQSYFIVSTFRFGRYAHEADLFRRLSEDFELCQYGLSLVRSGWEQLAAAPRRV